MKPLWGPEGTDGGRTGCVTTPENPAEEVAEEVVTAESQQKYTWFLTKSILRAREFTISLHKFT